MKSGKTLGIVSILTTFIVVLWGCGSTKTDTRTLRTQNLALTYVDQTSADRIVRALTLQHPLPITEKQMVVQMLSLRFQSNSLMGKSGRVFTKKDVQKVKGLLTKALNKAAPRNIIVFEVESSDGTTVGEVFATQGHLNWRFMKIRGVAYTLNSSMSPQRRSIWHLVPARGQKLYASKNILGAQKHTNWIVAKIDLPSPFLKKRAPQDEPGQATGNSVFPGTTPPAAPSSAPPGGRPELREKLEFLKHLLENKLIDQQEYQQKKKDLLDQYL